MSFYETSWIQSFLNTPAISRVRRNHGLEHATLALLSQRYPRQSMAGHSDTGGFWLMADVPLEAVQSAADEALERLRAGESNLAVHPNCGTNFATAGVLAGLAGGLAMLGGGSRMRDKVERLPLAIMGATLALILAQPLGMRLQEHVTTSGEPGDLRIVEISPRQRGGIAGSMKAYRVTTEG